MRLRVLASWLRAAARRRRPLPLLAALLALVITSALLQRHTADDVSGSLAGASDHPGRLPLQQTASEAPLQFYGAARGLSKRRKTLEAPPVTAQRTSSGATQLATQIRAQSTTSLGATQGADQGADQGAAPAHSSRPSFRWDRVLSPVVAEQLEPLTSDWLWRQHLVQAERRTTLATACTQHAVRLAAESEHEINHTDSNDADVGLVETIKASHMSVVPPLKTLVCLVNKAASSSLLATFLKLAGHGVPVFTGNISSPHANAKVLRPEKPGELEAARRHYIQLLFVRHPMDRLISAYEEKVVRAQHKSLHELRRAIFSKHEQLFIVDKAAELIRNGMDPASEMAVKKRYLAKLTSYRENVRRRKRVPTFQEFLDFILDGKLTGDSFDSHWTPYWRQCAPCHMKYDVISKLETGADDFKAAASFGQKKVVVRVKPATANSGLLLAVREGPATAYSRLLSAYVWNLLGIYQSVGIPWLNQRRRHHGTIEERLRSYVTPLRADTMRQLRRLFRPDFDMFGYDWRRMLDVSGHCWPGKACDLA